MQLKQLLRSPTFIVGIVLLAAISIAAYIYLPPPFYGMNLPSIDKAAAQFHNPNQHITEMLRDALTDAESQAHYDADGTVYVRTGDISGEWLRDSSAEVEPYLYFAKNPQVADFLKGVIARQGKDLQIDPYAMAFNEDGTVNQPWFELDSLSYPIELAWSYWKVTGDSSVFTPSLEKGFNAALATMLTEQHHNTRSTYKSPLTSHSPVGYTGMIWSAFRPSDGRVVYHYNIPGNMMTVEALKALAQIEGSVYHNQAKVAVIDKLGAQVNQGIQKYGIVHTKRFGDIYAYEVDGLGHHLLGDDANVPSLLSAPYLGYVSATNRTYLNTRKFILSPADPDYFQGSIASGVGSQENTVGYVWPLSLMMQGMTSTSKAEKEKVLKELLRSDPGDGYLHESFDPNNAQNYTRMNFGWPNSLFVQFYMVGFEGAKPLPTP